jgi:hypothetical protein
VVEDQLFALDRLLSCNIKRNGGQFETWQEFCFVHLSRYQSPAWIASNVLVYYHIGGGAKGTYRGKLNNKRLFSSTLVDGHKSALEHLSLQSAKRFSIQPAAIKEVQI